MTSYCIEKLAHECGTSDALQIFEERGRYTGYCFACDTYVEQPYAEGQRPVERQPTSPASIRTQIHEIISLPHVALSDRKLNKVSLNYFGLRTALSEVDGATPTVHYYPYYKKGELSAFKCRLLVNKKR